MQTGVFLTQNRAPWYTVEMEITYTLHVEPAEEGGYTAYFPALPGCHTQGENLEEVVAMAKDALAGYLECLQEDGVALPKETHIPKQVGFELPLSLSLAR